LSNSAIKSKAEQVVSPSFGTYHLFCLTVVMIRPSDGRTQAACQPAEPVALLLLSSCKARLLGLITCFAFTRKNIFLNS
jgi:hypothetical protein